MLTIKNKFWHTLLLLTALFLSLPAHASLITTSDLETTPYISGGNGDNSLTPQQVVDGRIDANTNNSRFTGVVSLEIKKNGSTFICTGTVISQQHILSAAHCADTNGQGTVMDLTQANTSIRAIFNHDGDSSAIISAETVQIHDDYNGFNICPDGSTGCLQDDVAVITLSESIPDGVEIYDFYTPLVQSTQFVLNGDILTLVGYGTRGDGYNGYYGAPTGSPSWTQKLVGGNIVDLIFGDDEGGAWGEIWYADFDGHNEVSGTDIDTLCNPTYLKCSSWLDENIETIIGGGDSGGPSFIYNSITDEYLLAGINTFGNTGIAENTGGFGDLFGGVLVNPYIAWIDNIVSASITATAVNAPQTLWLFVALLFILRSFAKKNFPRQKLALSASSV